MTAPTTPSSPGGPANRSGIDSIGLAARMSPFVSTVFAEMSALAVATGAINLGQGFPDTDGPPQVLDAAVTAIRSGLNQYPPGPGTPELRGAVAGHQQRFYGLDVDPGDVLVTTGATEAIAAAVLALTGPGDEVVMLEPYFDSYAAVVALSGAQRRTVVLRAQDGFALDPVALEAAFSERTALVLLNSPHNPTGRVLTPEEMAMVADAAARHGAVGVSDEGYEHLTVDGDHVPFATLPGMAERTLTISSAAKTFSVTGWKVGWVHGPSALVAAVRTVKQFLTFTSGAPFQPAVAAGLGLPDEVFAGMRRSLRTARDLTVDGLARAGLAPHVPAGTFFVVGDVAGLGWDDATAFCRALPRRAGVVAVPVAALADDVEAARTLVRFAFCKRESVLNEAMGRLAAADLGPEVPDPAVQDPPSTPSTER